MGKPEEEQPLPSGVASEDPQQNAEVGCRCRFSGIRKFVGPRCIFVLLLSAAVFLSALFWLPPFLRYADQMNLRADSKYKGHDIVASFIVNKSVSLLEDIIYQLESDIFDEIGVPATKVVVLSLDPLRGPNTTQVVFSVDPYGKYSEMSSTAFSLVRASFMSLVANESMLHLTQSLFGDPFFFQVLKFKGGITIIPDENAFPLQTGQTLFNFTLNFSIYEIQLNFSELTSQLKSGLHLAPYENLLVNLSNAEGSTVVAPTIVQSSVMLAIGITPSKERLKQLAQTIMGPHSKNLGLNNTKFGRVKQVRLSSILQHSLHGSDGSGSSWSPSPAPLPHPPRHHHQHHHHHHHHHHQHHHHHDAHLTPAISPIPAPATGEGATPPEVGSPAAAKRMPAPGKSSQAQPPRSAPAPWKSSQAQAPKSAPAPRKSSQAQAPKSAPVPKKSSQAQAPKNAPAPRKSSQAQAPKSVPAPWKSYQARPPNCRFGYRKRSSRNAGKSGHLTPAVAPTAPHYPVASPKSQVEPPAHVSHSVPALTPLPHVAFAHAEPPPKNEPAAERSNTHSHGPPSTSSSAGCLRTVKWASLVILVLVLHV